MNTDDYITVEVAYALPHKQLIIPVQIAPNMTAQEAIEMSGIISKFPEINLSKNKIGIFGAQKKLDTALKHMDRIEIYRPLVVDPKEMRRQRIADRKNMKQDD